MKRTIAFAVVAAIVVAACSKKAGDSCNFFDQRCLDARTELACKDGKLVVAPCHGPRGCWERASGDRLQCDVSANGVGEACGRSSNAREIDLLVETHSACTDFDEMIACVDGAYAKIPCRGGCTPETEKEFAPRAKCAAGTGKAGDRCLHSGPRGVVCGEDVLLECRDGKLVVDRACKDCSLGYGYDGVHVTCTHE